MEENSISLQLIVFHCHVHMWVFPVVFCYSWYNHIRLVLLLRSNLDQKINYQFILPHPWKIWFRITTRKCMQSSMILDDSWCLNKSLVKYIPSTFNFSYFWNEKNLELYYYPHFLYIPSNLWNFTKFQQDFLKHM